MREEREAALPRGGMTGVRTWRQKSIWFVKDQRKGPQVAGTR